MAKDGNDRYFRQPKGIQASTLASGTIGVTALARELNLGAPRS